MPTMTDVDAVSADPLRASYDDQGYLLQRRPVLGQPLLARAAAGLFAVRDGVYDTGRAPGDSPWRPGDDPRRLCKIEQPQRASSGLLEAISAPELGRIAAAALGAEEFVQVWWVQLLLKPGSAGADGPQVGWHQDLSYWSGWEEGSELATAWLALSDVGPDCGPMRFVPGSHQWGLRPGGDFFGQDQEELRAKLGAGRDWREVDATLPAGGFSLHHRLLIHGSGVNTSQQPRLSLALHLRTEKSRAKPGAWETGHIDDSAVCPVIWRAG